MREEKNLEVVNIDCRMNDTVCGQGGEWIPIRPGTDGALCAALAYEIINNGWADEEFLHTYCVGYDEETMPESAKGQNKSFKDYICLLYTSLRVLRLASPRCAPPTSTLPTSPIPRASRPAASR